MSMRFRRRELKGIARVPAVLALVASLFLAPPAGAITFCGGFFEPPCCGLPFEPACAPATPPPAPPSGTLLTAYYGGNPDSLVLINPVGCPVGRSFDPECASETDLCAMIYVFDSQENMGECCGCRLIPSGLQTEPVSALTTNWGGPSTPVFGIIDIVSAGPNIMISGQTACAPQSRYVPTRELNGYVVHNGGLSEVPLADAGDPDSTTQNSLLVRCENLINTGNGKGVCSCGN